MPTKREIISISPLPSYPGHWLLNGRTEGEFGTWHVIRKPNGSYRTALMPLGSDKDLGAVEIGDKVTEAGVIDQFESGFVSLRNGEKRSLAPQGSIQASA